MFSIKNLFVFTILMLLNLTTILSAEKIRCSTTEVFRKNAINHPEVVVRKQQLENDIQQWLNQNGLNRQNGIEAVITIPVVVHIVYKTTAENISDAQVQSQIDRLNKDFRNLNTDKLLSTHPFFSLAGDAGIEFCLAQVDPNGNATTGITRTNTSVTSFTDNDDVKFSSSGGIEPWDATKYLNIWVCNLSGDLLGYAQFPSDLGSFPETDGVVIGYTSFGTTGTATIPYNLGRTATHEIGHWLNLEHIWGDDNDCSGSDGVSDTPNQEKETTSCPSGVKTDNCTTTSPGIMYQNYMDYTQDACMVMFTTGQINRMKAVFNIARAGILTSNKCSGTTGVSTLTKSQLRIYPNPVENYLTIENLPKTKSKVFTIDIINAIGQKVYTNIISFEDTMMEMSALKTGTYIMMIYNDEFSATQKLTVVK
ncbi:MAG: M43 family zinc metalloprotease [Chitinophagales bacterium]